jgi:hypothetical protein
MDLLVEVQAPLQVGGDGSLQARSGSLQAYRRVWNDDAVGDVPSRTTLLDLENCEAGKFILFYFFLFSKLMMPTWAGLMSKTQM